MNSNNGKPILIKTLLTLLIAGLFISTGISAFILSQQNSATKAPDWIGKCSDQLSAEVLNHSLELGTSFLLNNQYPAGNFTYQYDWVRQTYDRGDNQVRQAGALWGLALIYQFSPEQNILEAAQRGFEFFLTNSKLDDEGRRVIIYPGDRRGKTGTVALVTLAYLDFLRTAASRLPADEMKLHRRHMDEYLKMLISLRRSDGLWYGGYEIPSGRAKGNPSPYSDGEALLALAKAARYFGRSELKPLILASADRGYEMHIRQALQQNPDSNTTKGFYQWSSMAFYEIATSGWKDSEKYGAYIIELAHWMIDVHATLQRTRNTAYAYEGIVHAYKMALDTGDMDAAKKFACVIEKGLTKLTSWQIGSPIANRYISSNPTDDKKAIGGVQNHRKEAPLRIDVTQHQMHAVILALKYYFPAST